MSTAENNSPKQNGKSKKKKANRKEMDYSVVVTMAKRSKCYIPLIYYGHHIYGLGSIICK